MKLREKPLIPWVICETTGKVLCGHCNCMAGLGESCSHIATILWAIEAGVQVRNSITVTQKKPIGFYQLLSKMCLLPHLRITSLKGIVEL